MAREDPHDAQAPGPFRRLHGLSLLRPRERQRRRHDRGSVRFHERDELEQQAAGVAQGKAQAAPHGQVLLDG
jgi:hypothetical protein